jgi:hypothetical protein
MKKEFERSNGDDNAILQPTFCLQLFVTNLKM